jgi:hypothetical protein
MSNELENTSQFLLYTSDNGNVKAQVIVQDETVWASQKVMAEIFGVEEHTITYHLKNIFESNELEQSSTARKIRVVRQEGSRQVKREIDFFNLDAIISVGYRVNSSRATRFRIWATRTLREYLIKGFILDDERLKQGSKLFEQDYFRELLERVRSIRASERRIYQQITDIFAECSIDYDPESEQTQNFYATVQNKFHYAITGQTAAEIIYAKSDHKSPNAGLTTWKNAPEGRILSSDITVAKNYLEENEIRKLERTISGFFDYIENVIENRVQMTMQGMAESVDKFLTFNEYRILHGKGSISKAAADKKAIVEYKEFNRTQKIESDFDKMVKGITASPKPPKIKSAKKKTDK